VLHIKYLEYTLADDLPRVFKLINYCTEVMVSSNISEADRSQLFLHCANLDKTIYVVPQFTDLIYTKFRIIQFQDMPTFMIDSLGLTFQQRLLKRIFDVLFSFLALIFTAPLQLLSIPVDQDRVSGVCKTPQSGVITPEYSDLNSYYPF